jgi:hypothetical protein
MPFGFFMSEHPKQHACHRYANLEGQRSQECERGTHECVRHNQPKTK